MDLYSSSLLNDDSNPPRLFINWSVLQQILHSSASIDSGINNILLLKLDGSLLTAAHTDADVAKQHAATMGEDGTEAAASSSSSVAPVPSSIVGALVANIFKTTELNGLNYLGAQQLNMIMLDCESGHIAVCRLARFLIVIQAKKDTNAGQIRLKMNELNANLQALQNVYAQ